MTTRALILLLGLWLVLPLLGLAGRACAQNIPEPTWVCVECGHGPPHDVPGCPCCNPDGGGGGGDGGAGGNDDGGQVPDGGFFAEVITAPVVVPVLFTVGLGLGFTWMFLRLTGGTDQGIFEYLDSEGPALEDEAGGRWVFGSGALALSGVVTFALYLPVLGVTELVGLVVDDDDEAFDRVAALATDVRADHAAAHLEFVAAHPPPSPTDEGALAALVDDASARRARVEEALTATNDVTATPAPATPAWPTAPLVDPATRTVAPPSARGPAAFKVPPLPATTAEAERASGVLERTRRLLREGAAAAREEVIDEVKDRALGLLPERVERALRANLAAQEGTTSMLERVRDEAVPLLAFGSAQEVGALERDLDRQRLETAERVLDEALDLDDDDGWLDLVRRGLRARERDE